MCMKFLKTEKRNGKIYDSYSSDILKDDVTILNMIVIACNYSGLLLRIMDLNDSVRNSESTTIGKIINESEFIDKYKNLNFSSAVMAAYCKKDKITIGFWFDSNAICIGYSENSNFNSQELANRIEGMLNAKFEEESLKITCENSSCENYEMCPKKIVVNKSEFSYLKSPREGYVTFFHKCPYLNKNLKCLITKNTSSSLWSYDIITDIEDVKDILKHKSGFGFYYKEYYIQFDSTSDTWENEIHALSNTGKKAFHCCGKYASADSKEELKIKDYYYLLEMSMKFIDKEMESNI